MSGQVHASHGLAAHADTVATTKKRTDYSIAKLYVVPGRVDGSALEEPDHQRSDEEEDA